MKTSQRLPIVGNSRNIRHLFSNLRFYPASSCLYLAEDVLDEFETELDLSMFWNVQDTYDPTKDLLAIVTSETLERQ